MYYNIRIKHYANGDKQLTTYEKPIYVKEDGSKSSIKTDVLGNWDKIEKTTLSEDLLIDIYKEWNNKYAKEFDEELAINCLSEEELKDYYKNIEYKKELSKRKSLTRSKNKVFDYARNNVWEWFLTFTFSSDCVNSREDFVETSKKIRTWFNNQKKRYSPDGKYLLVPEGHKNGAWHYHALVSGFNFNMSVAINPHTCKPIKFKGLTVYNVLDYKLGFTTATRVTHTQKASNYIAKYINKSLIDLDGRQRYYVSNNCTLPQVEYLASIGDLVENVHLNVSSSGLDILYSKDVLVKPNGSIVADSQDYSDLYSYFNRITYYELGRSDK